MYLNILKRDLKRKKTMNIILLLFIIIATTFVSSSINNMVSISTALDNYFEISNAPDYTVVTLQKGTTEDVKDVLDSIEAVDSYGMEEFLIVAYNEFEFHSSDIEAGGSYFLQSFDEMQLNIFDDDNNKITELNEGEMIVPKKLMNTLELEVGDKITINFAGVKETFTIVESSKDVLFGGTGISFNRMLISQSDYDKFALGNEQADLFKGNISYVTTDDVKAVEQEINNRDCGITLAGDQTVFTKVYTMDMVVSGILLVVSICLIIISFVVLRFTIGFTLSEEYREIGVMKAIGIKNVKIRGLYMVKYLALALIGASVGFALSIPFGNMLLSSASEYIIIENSNALTLNIVCSLFIVALTLLFCFNCTGKAKKFTPVDAIRNGETGKRYKRKGLLKLSKTHLKPSGFLSLNDVISNIKRFVIIILTFAVCLSLVLIMVNSSNTLKGDSIISFFGMVDCDLIYSDDQKQMSYMVEDGREDLKKDLEEVEKILAENDMPANCYYEVLFKFTATYKDANIKSYAFQGVNTTTDQYVYNEGTAPQNTNEIAMTKIIADKLGVEIGDTVTLTQMEGEKEYIVTGLFQTMMNMGEGIRMHEDVDLNYLQASGCMAYQIDFTDNPSKAEFETRKDEIKDLLNVEKVYTITEYSNNMTGVVGMIDGMTFMILGVAMIIIILITVLMERSFIAKERGEIALLKAIGFKDSSIIMWHSLRFVIVSIISTIISLATLIPFTNLAVGPIFTMMGAGYGMEYVIDPIAVFMVYPLIVVATTLISVILTALHIRTIKSSEISGIE